MGLLIGIAGKKQHGKDSVATMIQVIDSLSNGITHPDQVILEPWEYVSLNKDALPNTNFQIRKFADSLKDMICVLLKCTRRELEDPIFKETPLGEEWWAVKESTGLTPYSDFFEKAKQNIPEEAIIKTTPRLLLQSIGTQWGRMMINPNIWVLSTLRKWNDNQNWIITDVRFPNEAEAIKERGGVLIKVERPGMKNNDPHPSENALNDYSDFDYFVLNDEGLEEMQEQVELICTDLDIISNAYYAKLGYN